MLFTLSMCHLYNIHTIIMYTSVLKVTLFFTQVATVAQLDQTTMSSATEMEDSVPASLM